MIKILPPTLVNKIAAGEVVQRPASVVKELVENSIDAGAKQISVFIRGSAIGGIEVVDDGCGMDEDDAALCLRHHATSKIENENDLPRISTLGFRGEALSSIAAVSRFTLVTNREGSDSGIKVYAVGGEIKTREPAASAHGTRIKIEDLFFNVPARLKFLKSVRTEETLVGETIRNLALTCPEITFRYSKDGRKVLSLPAAGETQRVEEALKGKDLYHVSVGGGVARLRAYLTPPERARRGTGGLVLIVNGRSVFDRAIAGAIAAAHEGLLEKGRYPEGVLFLQVPQEDVDVNVHPQKREIRFSNPSAIFGFIRRSINEALKNTPWLPQRKTDAAEISIAASRAAAVAENVEEYTANQTSIPPRPQKPTSIAEPAALPAGEAGSLLAWGFFSSAVPLAQVFSTYILCEKDDDLLIIDQHAAAERITYEQLRRQYRSGSVRLQTLLMPALAQMEEKDILAVEENEGFLRAIGIDASVAGRDCASVRALPSILGNVNPVVLLREIVDELQSTRGRTEEAVELILQRMACHGSIRAGRTLEREEITALLSRLDEVDFSTHCPHGRPVYMTIPRSEIEKKLGRK